MKYNYIFLFLLTWTTISHAQIQQIAYVLSQGAGIENNNGTYTSTVIVGESISGQVPTGNFQGSTFGFLSNTSTNAMPIADAGTDQDADSGETVQLDGSASSDDDGDILTYTWTSLDGAVLNNPNIVNPTFTAPAVNAVKSYRFELRVNDGQSTSAPDEVVVEVYNPTWRPVTYTNSASLIGNVTIDAVNAVDGDLVGVFANGENRGIGEVFTSGGMAFISMNIQSENTVTVNFRVYDVSQNQICEVQNTLSITPGSDYGDPSNPIPINAACESNCSTSIHHGNGSLASGTYQSQSTITSSALITNNANVIYVANGNISLENGFEVTMGSTFETRAGNCSALQAAVEDRSIIKASSIKKIDLKVQPNPFSEQTTVALNLPKEMPISMFLTDVQGQKIRTLVNQTFQFVTRQTLTLNRDGLKSGIYFIVLQTETEQLIKKVVVLP